MSDFYTNFDFCRFMSYLRYILILSILSGVITGCQTEKDKHYTEIKHSEKILLNDSLKMQDSVAYALFDQYNQFASVYPDDKNTPEFLFKAAELANSLGMHERALSIFGSIPKKYPKFNKAPECLFITGFIYENQLGDFENARKAYTTFIEAYPKHPLARDAAFSLKNLGKSAEELFREFETRKQ